MVVDYKQGRIYKIVSPCGLTYYGSTTQRIMDRMKDHVSRAKLNKGKASQPVIEAGGEMFLVEMYPCNSEKELWAREGWYQRNRPCVNEVIAGRTRQQYRFDKRDEIRRKTAQPYDCECGSTIRRNEKARHLKTMKHQRWVEQNQ